MSAPEDLIVVIRRRLAGVEEEIKRLARTIGSHEGRLGTLEEHGRKSHDIADQLEARMIDHEAQHHRKPRYL